MLFKVLRRMIEKGKTEGMVDKLDIFFAADKLTKTEYEELTGRLLPQPVTVRDEPAAE